MKILVFVLISFVSLVSQAQVEFGILGGFRSSEIDTGIDGATTSSRSGLQVGPVGYFPLSSNWGVRSGFIYTQRYSHLNNTAAGDVDAEFSYFDVPATLQLRIGDVGGIFAGPVIAFNQSKDTTCTKKDCVPLDMKSIIVPFQAGVNFRMLPQMGAELFFEYVSGDLAKDISNMRTVGANLVFFFE